jgi:hypothetical protein
MLNYFFLGTHKRAILVLSRCLRRRSPWLLVGRFHLRHQLVGRWRWWNLHPYFHWYPTPLFSSLLFPLLLSPCLSLMWVRREHQRPSRRWSYVLGRQHRLHPFHFMDRQWCWHILFFFFGVLNLFLNCSFHIFYLILQKDFKPMCTKCSATLDPLLRLAPAFLTQTPWPSKSSNPVLRIFFLFLFLFFIFYLPPVNSSSLICKKLHIQCEHWIRF